MRQSLGWEGQPLGYYAKTLLSEKKNYQIHYYRRKTINETGAGLGGSAVGILRKDTTIGEKLPEKNYQ